MGHTNTLWPRGQGWQTEQCKLGLYRYGPRRQSQEMTPIFLLPEERRNKLRNDR